ncbi:hypothetical protein COU17_02620 [Candidatus Kaiserbacteria bacterium CG10_big_fil_rev_8_21_14_0_10_49_17]|uniref:Aspartyl/glutamyl-tRNA(Asn/Gln) amidotransferase subunit C n=1 Tax=Candidatus Kaiserbacteria bacterium CG10_big_fil_rev_8_21_14_0_10_49_17 TaxID=1974609 RepID=A0A2M6WE48_9BACT|nr:MAG: hypothetical protein COU17_02620 [Candidatus Kaiserbacteria bacterium CG10_big_fil_rev_8_21_14_0_10_49_17]
MINESEIEKLATLARVRISDEEKKALVEEIDTILEYVDQIQDVAGDAEEVAGEHRNILREDGEPHERGAYTEAIVEQFPKREGQSLSVRKVIDQG